jgi:hypothetical protein
MHVDSAMAGAAMLLPELRRHWIGIEQADSIVVNAHKWLVVLFDCSVYFVGDAGTWSGGCRRTRATRAVPWIRRYRDWGCCARPPPSGTQALVSYCVPKGPCGCVPGFAAISRMPDG